METALYCSLILRSFKFFSRCYSLNLVGFIKENYMLVKLIFSKETFIYTSLESKVGSLFTNLFLGL